MKKLLSICLAVLVVVGLMPVYALADDGDPVGDPTGGSDMTVYTVNAAATGGSISIVGHSRRGDRSRPLDRRGRDGDQRHGHRGRRL